MTLEISVEFEARLKTRASAAGLSVAAYVERLISEEEDRFSRLAEFQRAVHERFEALQRGQHSDGEEVMARLIDEVQADPRISDSR